MYILHIPLTSLISHLSPSHIILVLLILYLLYSLLTIFYNLYLHPLRHFPGPLLSRSTPWYHTYQNCFTRTSHRLSHSLPSLHAHYGPILRIEPNTIHFSTPSAHSTIYHFASSNQKFPKTARFYHAFGEHDELAFICDPMKAKIRRDRYFAPDFTRRRVLTAIQSIIKEKFSRLAERMVEETQWGDIGSFPDEGGFDLFRACRAAALDVVTQHAIDECRNAVEAEGFADSLCLLVEQCGTAVEKAFWWSMHFGLRWVIVGLVTPILAGKMKTMGGLQGVVEASKRLKEKAERTRGEGIEKRRRGVDSEDSVLLRMALDGAEEKTLCDEGSGLIFAGVDNVGNALTVGLAHLAYDKPLQKALLDELTTIWVDIDDPAPPLEALEKLSILSGCVKESLRLSHGLPSPLWRTAAQDSIIDGVFIPKGTEVGISPTVLHLNPSTFPAPYSFIPSRWSSSTVTGTQTASLVAFSRGDRGCVGKEMGMAELVIGIATVIRKTELRLKNEDKDGMEGKGLWEIVGWKGPMDMVYEGRHVQVCAQARVE